ncbi:MAG: hypothetical protein NW206_00410 [Hyphomonadaceae bacterium]|nr:hypothetical protein [Hyphomonadaceae bacterium]
MSVSARYILAAIAFAIAALGLLLLPVEASADCGGAPSCPPPQPPCCTRPSIVVPPPHVPPPNIVVVNSGARASAAASAVAIAVANASVGDTIIRSNVVADAGASAYAGVTNSALAVAESATTMERVAFDRMLLLQAICLDASNNPHPASQTFGGRDVREDYTGELYRCVAGTHMRVTMDGRTFDCESGEALWYQNGQATCRPQIERRPCNERSLLRRYGAGDKMVRIRGEELREVRTETSFNGAMSMDGGVGSGVW